MKTVPCLCASFPYSSSLLTLDSSTGHMRRAPPPLSLPSLLGGEGLRELIVFTERSRRAVLAEEDRGTGRPGKTSEGGDTRSTTGGKSTSDESPFRFPYVSLIIEIPFS